MSGLNIHQNKNYRKQKIGLATLLEGAILAFDFLKVFKNSKINYGCFKAVKLVKKVIFVFQISKIGGLKCVKLVKSVKLGTNK